MPPLRRSSNLSGVSRCPSKMHATPFSSSSLETISIESMPKATWSFYVELDWQRVESYLVGLTGSYDVVRAIKRVIIAARLKQDMEGHGNKVGGPSPYDRALLNYERMLQENMLPEAKEPAVTYLKRRRYSTRAPANASLPSQCLPAGAGTTVPFGSISDCELPSEISKPKSLYCVETLDSGNLDGVSIRSLELTGNSQGSGGAATKLTK